MNRMSAEAGWGQGGGAEGRRGASILSSGKESERAQGGKETVGIH